MIVDDICLVLVLLEYILVVLLLQDDVFRLYSVYSPGKPDPRITAR
jgi:hypothetical protein